MMRDTEASAAPEQLSTAELFAVLAAPVWEAPPPPKPKKKLGARVEHKIPGRMRLKIRGGVDNAEALAGFVAAFSAMPGVTKVKAKPETGSITIHYDTAHAHLFDDHLAHCCHHNEIAVEGHKPDDEIHNLAKRIENEAEYLAEHSEFARSSVNFFKGVDRELKLISNNTIDLKIFLAGGLTAFTFLEIGAAAATPMWVTLALFTLNHLAELQVAPLPADTPADPDPARAPVTKPAAKRAKPADSAAPSAPKPPPKRKKIATPATSDL